MQRQISLKSDSTTSGFTLLEGLITLVLLGVLFAIAAPNWFAFINQQRVGSARNQASQAIRTAQSQAQQTKVNRAVVFDNNNDQPRYAIVAAPNNTVDRSQIKNWQLLGDSTDAIRLWGNRGANRTEPDALVFDGYGAVVASVSPVPYVITIGSTAGVNPKRCVSVETLLGATADNSNADCPAP